MIAGYEPRRIARLDHHTRRALASLDHVTSADTAAAGAVAAVGRLRTVLADGFVPAVTSIMATDPLAAGCTFFDDRLRTQLDRRAPTQFSDHDNVDLAVLLHIELTRQMEDNGVPDPDDPFWSGEFLEWVAEFEHRARTDTGFGTFLTDEVDRNPLVGYIVAAGDFDGDVLIALTTALMDSSPNGAQYDTYRDGAIQALVETISDQPTVALTLLGRTDMTERLLTWNEREGGAFGLDGGAIGTLFESALGHPFDEPERMGEAHEILQQLVDLAHGPIFDRGFPPGTAPGIATGLIGHLPSLVDSLGLDGDVFFENSRGRFEMRLGSAAAVVDLFGSLMRNAASLALLLATIPALAVGATTGLFDLDAVNNYVVTLVEAAETEQIEEGIHAARTRADWHTAIGVVSTILETAFTVGGPEVAVARHVVNVVESGARWLVERIAADELGIDDVRTTAFLLLTYGVAVAFLDRRRDDDRDDDDRDDDPRIADADELTDEIDRLLAEDGSPDDIEKEIRNLRALIEAIGGDDAFGDARRSTRRAPGIRRDERCRSRRLEDPGGCQPIDLESAGQPTETVGRREGEGDARQRRETHRLAGGPEHLQPRQLQSDVQRVEIGELDSDVEVDAVQRHLRESGGTAAGRSGDSPRSVRRPKPCQSVVVPRRFQCVDGGGEVVDDVGGRCDPPRPRSRHCAPRHRPRTARAPRHARRLRSSDDGRRRCGRDG